MKMQTLAIIGGGPAGYTAAAKAGKAGLNVILFEKDSLGGVCLNEGCIPTKTLLYSAKLLDNSKEAKRYAINIPEATYDLKRIYSRKNKIVRKLVLGVKGKMEEANVTCIAGEARLVDNKTIECNGSLYNFDKLIIATGSDSFVPPINGLNEIEYWTHKEALSLKELPKSLIIVGGGVIGLEFASFFNSLGCQVTIVELMNEILPGLDKQLAAELRNEYTKKGIQFLLGTKVQAVANLENQISVQVNTSEDEQQLIADKLLLSTGRVPYTKGLNLESLNLVSDDKKRIVIDNKMQSSNTDVFICGDVNGKSLLAHTAIREAEVAVNTILGVEDSMSYQAIPSVVYTNPEFASVSVTEEQLKDSEINYSTQTLPLTYSGRFVAENEGFNGLCKVLINQNDQTILGVHILGNPASEIITIATMAIEMKLTVKEWNKIVFPHPTVNEIFKDFL